MILIIFIIVTSIHMGKPPVTISTNKGYAAVFYMVLLICSVFFLIERLMSSPVGDIISIVKIIACFFAISISLFGMYSLFSKRFEYNSNSSIAGLKEPFIIITEQELICNYPSDSKKEKISWGSISRIQILTTDEGPYVCDVFIILTDSDGAGVTIPQEKEECKEIIDRIMQFPGFNFGTFMAAMSSVENKIFDVWEKKEETQT